VRKGQILRARHQRQENWQTIEVSASGRVASQLQRLPLLYGLADALIITCPCASHESNLTWALDRSKWSLHGRFSVRNRLLYQLIRRFGGPQSWSAGYGDETCRPCRQSNHDSIGRPFGSLDTIPTKLSRLCKCICAVVIVQR
jgi:hypothetical protein